MNVDAVFSPCGLHRIWISRIWDEAKGLICWSGCNPSKAGATYDDPTVRRMMRFTRDLGYGGLYVVNAISRIATDPEQLLGLTWDNLVAHDNFNELIYRARLSRIVIACWGAVDPQIAGYFDQAVKLYRDNGIALHCLGTTKHGAPRHPLYLRADSPLTLWKEAA